VFQILGNGAQEVGIFQSKDGKKTMRESNSICNKATKGIARREGASILLVKESTGILQHMGYVSKKHSTRRKEIEDTVESSDIYRV